VLATACDLPRAIFTADSTGSDARRRQRAAAACGPCRPRRPAVLVAAR
jgi:hypothetical protein